jgi:hypothetical protein
MDSPPPRRDQTLGAWLMEPQTLIALSAVVIGVSGLFISLYEASLIRQEQRAAVWPRVGIGFAVNDSAVTVVAENAGVGPARVQSAQLRYNDSTLVNWMDLVKRTTTDPVSVNRRINLLNGRVLSPGTRVDIVHFSFREEKHASELARSVLSGSTDVRACYCSVYDDCWVTSLQDRIPRG